MPRREIVPSRRRTPTGGRGRQGRGLRGQLRPPLESGGGSLSAVVNDGFLQGAPAPVPVRRRSDGGDPQAAERGDPGTRGETIGQFDSIKLAAPAKDADNGELAAALRGTPAPVEGSCVPAACTGNSVDLLPPAGGWTPGQPCGDPAGHRPQQRHGHRGAVFNVRLDCRQRLCSNGNPSPPQASCTPVNLSKAVSLVLSSPDPRSATSAGRRARRRRSSTSPRRHSTAIRATRWRWCSATAKPSRDRTATAPATATPGRLRLGNGLGFGGAATAVHR